MRRACVVTIQVVGGPQDGEEQRMIGWPGDKSTVFNADGSKALELEVFPGRTGNELRVVVYCERVVPTKPTGHGPTGLTS